MNATDLINDIEGMDNAQIEAMLPTHKEVCPRCHGHGSHDPDAFRDGFTASEFDECFETPEEKADYFRGRYDVTCTECKGQNVVDAVNVEMLTDEEKVIYDYLCQRWQEDYYCEMEMEAERRMGC